MFTLSVAEKEAVLRARYVGVVKFPEELRTQFICAAIHEDKTCAELLSSRRMKTYDIVAPSNVFPPPAHALVSIRSRCVFIANPLTGHSLLDIESEVPTIPFNGHVDCMRLSADERNIAIASCDLIKLIDLTRGREIRNLSGHSMAVKALTPRRSSVYSWVSGSLDSSWIVWDSRCYLHSCVSGSLDSSWIVWDSRSHPANVLQGRTTAPVRCVELSPDDVILAVGTDSTLQLYDLRKRCVLKQFPASTNGATFHPSQRMVATYGGERVVRFWCLDEFVPIAMSDAFSSTIRCAEFASPSPQMDPVLVASTDHYMKTLTCEPCESLAVNQIGDLRKVLNINATADGVGAICTDSVGAVSYCVIPMEEILHGSKKPVDFSDDDESLSDEITAITLRRDSSSISREETSSLRSPDDHVSSSEGRMDDSLGSDINRITTRSSSAGRNTSFRSRIRSQRQSAERRTESDRNLVGRPRSPSVPSIQTNCETPSLRPRECSRVVCRSVSPANGTLPKDAPSFISKPHEKSSRVTPGTKPPRNSSQGMTVSDFVAKLEKQHYMTVMQAEKTAIGVQQLVSSLKHGGMSNMLKDGLFADELAVAAMLRMFTEMKRWDINICNSYLPKLKEFLQDTSLPESCRSVALSSLQCIATSLIDSLKNCSRAPVCTIGVDVAAEERKRKADNCIKELRELRDKREQFYRKLSQEEVYRLDAIMVFLKSL
ncbi:hypothetical protein Q1695_008957 [Nippostrongylus brasiliensis]|nr:hypothetical protein Q1695_008957 [Nippostrongylus brasiliensis]